MVDGKIRTDVYILSGGMGASVTPEKRVPINKKNMKPSTLSPPRKYTITNQYIKRLIIIKDKVFYHI